MTKWTIPADLVGRLRDWGDGITDEAAERIEDLEAALRAIITEAPSLNYARSIAREALHGGRNED